MPFVKEVVLNIRKNIPRYTGHFKATYSVIELK